MNSPVQPEPKWKTRFFTIWTGQQLSWIGSSVAQFALVWWVTETTESATVLATATMVSLLPGVLLGPFIGALVDRWNRRLVMLVADGFIALASIWLAYLFWIDALQIWQVYVIMLARSLGGSFHFPAMQASTPLMVPSKHLSRVAGLNQTIGGAVSIMSPPLGALLLGLMPLHSIMAIDVITAAFSIAPLLFIDVPQPPRRQAAEGEGKRSVWDDVREGFRYMWEWPGLVTLCGLAIILNFIINPAMSLQPLLVTKHFGGAALQLGWMNSSWGVGLVVGGVILSTWGGFQRRSATILMGVIGLGIGISLVGLAPATAFPLALGGMFLAGLMNSMTNGSVFALFQGVVSPEMQGRVFMVTMSLVNLMSPLSLAIAGPVADEIGIRILYIIAGVASIVVGVGGFFIPAFMGLEDGRGAKTDAREMAASAGTVPVAAED